MIELKSKTNENQQIQNPKNTEFRFLKNQEIFIEEPENTLNYSKIEDANLKTIVTCQNDLKNAKSENLIGVKNDENFDYLKQSKCAPLSMKEMIRNKILAKKKEKSEKITQFEKKVEKSEKSNPNLSQTKIGPKINSKSPKTQSTENCKEKTGTQIISIDLCKKDTDDKSSSSKNSRNSTLRENIKIQTSQNPAASIRKIPSIDFQANKNKSVFSDFKEKRIPHCPQPETLNQKPKQSISQKTELEEIPLDKLQPSVPFFPKSKQIPSNTNLGKKRKPRLRRLSTEDYSLMIAKMSEMRLTDIRFFLNHPLPENRITQCKIVRDRSGLINKFYPVFHLYLNVI